MSKIKIKVVNDHGYHTCEVRFQNGNKTNIVDWECEAFENSSRLFIFMLLLRYTHGNEVENVTSYFLIVKAISKICPK